MVKLTGQSAIRQEKSRPRGKRPGLFIAGMFDQ
jgi:hypothetical protein